MDSSKIYSISFGIFKLIEAEAKKNNTTPKLISNIAFTKFNRELKLDPASPDAALITSEINNYILSNYYSNVLEQIGYTEPNKEYLENPEEWNVNQYSDGQYGFEEKPKRS